MADDDHLADAAEASLQSAAVAGAVVVCGVVFAELLATEQWDSDMLAAAFAEMGVETDHRCDADVWISAGAAYARYLRTRWPAEYTCPACGTRQRCRCRSCRAELGRPKHVLPDFLIGAHALRYGHTLLTDDTGLYESFFPTLRLMPFRLGQ